MASHKCHDLDGNGNVTKDEVVWARRLKTRYYKSLQSGGSKSGGGKSGGDGKAVKGTLTDEVMNVYTEDNDLFLKLDEAVQNTYIVSHSHKGPRDPKSLEKSKKAIHHTFVDADANADGKLDYTEF